MQDFPVSEIKPIRATLSGKPGEVKIEIFLKAFRLALENRAEEIETSIRLEQIDLPTTNIKELEGKTFTFPVNPEPGYIDGSVYLLGAHHPVDVTEITFANAKNGKVSVTVKTTWVLEFENSGFKDFQTDIQFDI